MWYKCVIRNIVEERKYTAEIAPQGWRYLYIHLLSYVYHTLEWLSTCMTHHPHHSSIFCVWILNWMSFWNGTSNVVLQMWYRVAYDAISYYQYQLCLFILWYCHLTKCRLHKTLNYTPFWSVVIRDKM